eukprot:TRINITY_DN21573_c0_g1_i1.p1 TRINITY_DN21573_c0_g1~~TRINITY_DN21573_c0_g1_i1.p1  ORF type:complete len:262 (-),score=14.45 TRINITY_DN21573_c0_g1_i1:170-955(-)
MTSRDIDAGSQAADKISQKYNFNDEQVLVRQLDLTKLNSINNFSQEILKVGDPLHYLILNAGIMASPQSYTQAGFELQIGTNHFGHFALTQQLLPKMKAQDFESRIITVSSSLHKKGQIVLEDLHYRKGRQYDPYDAYAQSKLANILFAKQLAVNLEGTTVKSFCLHPGVIPTNLSRYMGVMGWIFRKLPVASIFPFMKTPEQGASTTVYAATASELSDKSGAYLGDCSIETPAEQAQDMKMAVDLWKVTEEQLTEVQNAL